MKYTFDTIDAKCEYSKERGYGFAPRGEFEPYEFDIYTGKNAEYDVAVTIKSSVDTVISLMTQSRRFMLKNEPITAGKTYTYTFSVSVCDIHKFGTNYYVWDKIALSLMADAWCITEIEATEHEMPVIYIAGDSTVTDQPAEYPYEPHSTFCGWGQMVGGFLKPGIAVSNHAQSGSTTAEFMSSNWEVVKSRLKPGDVLIVEFGHNDQKITELDAYGGYRKNLIYYINEAKARGAYPIINAPINRIIFQPDGTITDLLGEYAAACRDTAAEYGVPFVNMLTLTTEFFEAAGAIDAWNWFRCKGDERDYTHTNDLGGELIAKMFLGEVVKQGIKPIADFVDTDKIKYEMPDPCAKPIDSSNPEVLAHIAGIGLINVPKNGAIPDIDNDIRNI